MREPGFDPETFELIGAAIEVHRVLGNKFLETAYHRGLMYEFDDRGIPYQHEVNVPLFYKGDLPLGVPFRADFLCGNVIIEVKALPATGHQEARQLRHYVTATKFRVGLMLNFGTPILQIERYDHPEVS